MQVSPQEPSRSEQVRAGVSCGHDSDPCDLTPVTSMPGMFTAARGREGKKWGWGRDEDVDWGEGKMLTEGEREWMLMRRRGRDVDDEERER
ncbi:hypothetical protein Pmani_009190 [Petrolisthes manimaculis]|uniref:Uncharacterized protein n=1 Tax=Petrolisthes manimaculis TaxID=1843537 RepID=A0AAE1Q5H9_9EUCA|nr:hypothetical protein Pmani_009190 [Petrolisthes manimaculis]